MLDCLKFRRSSSDLEHFIKGGGKCYVVKVLINLLSACFRGTEAQLEKNRRKILRLQHELHLVKVGFKCSHNECFDKMLD